MTVLKKTLIPRGRGGKARRPPFFFGAEKSPYPADEEAPVIKAFIKNALWVDKTEATVAQFAKFADATNYQTTAEREGWSFVFEPFLSPATSVRETQAVKDTPWWVLVNGAVVDLQNASTSKHVLTHKSQYPTTGASWRKPEGPDSSSLSQLVEPDDQPVQPPRPQHQYGTPRTPAFPSFTGDRLDHPAVHISFHDAVAYCRWRGMRVPTEIEWEYAARGGLVNRTFPWGNRHDDLNTRANTFDGSRGFPLYVERDAEGNFPPSDGFDGSAPVASFAPNAFGLYDVSGNAWEWAIAVDKASGGATDKAVLRGGSFMCWHAHCFRYRVSARLRMDKDTGNYHTGVRCVADAQTGDGMAEL